MIERRITDALARNAAGGAVPFPGAVPARARPRPPSRRDAPPAWSWTFADPAGPGPAMENSLRLLAMRIILLEVLFFGDAEPSCRSTIVGSSGRVYGPVDLLLAAAACGQRKAAWSQRTFLNADAEYLCRLLAALTSRVNALEVLTGITPAEDWIPSAGPECGVDGGADPTLSSAAAGIIGAGIDALTHHVKLLETLTTAPGSVPTPTP